METNEEEKIKLVDLDVEDEFRAMLAFMINPRTIAQLAAKFERSYSYAHQKLAIWDAQGLVRKHKSLGGKTIYQLNKNKIEV